MYSSWACVSSAHASSFPTSVSSLSSIESISDKGEVPSIEMASPAESTYLHPEVSMSHAAASDTEARHKTPRGQACYLTSAVDAKEVLTISQSAPGGITPKSADASSGARAKRSSRGKSVFDPDLAASLGHASARGREKGEFLKRNVGVTICLRNLGLQVVSILVVSCDLFVFVAHVFLSRPNMPLFQILFVSSYFSNAYNVELTVCCFQVIYHPQGLCSSALNVAERLEFHLFVCLFEGPNNRLTPNAHLF